MHLEIIILSEVTQTEKDKYHMKYHIYVESHFEKDTNEPIFKTEADLQTSKTN